MPQTNSRASPMIPHVLHIKHYQNNTLYDYIAPRKAPLVIRNLYFGFGVCIPQVANNTLQWALTAHRL